MLHSLPQGGGPVQTFLILLSFQNRDLFGNGKWMPICFLCLHSRSFPGLGTSLTLRSASSHTRSPPGSAAEIASSVISLEKLFGGLFAGRRTDDRESISHCSEFPVYFLTAEWLGSYLQESLGAWRNRESDVCSWRATFTTHLSFNE